MFKKMTARKAKKLAKIVKASYAELAEIINQCYADGVLTQRERNTLMKVSERIEAIKANEEKTCRLGNTARTTDPIWDSRNSDEPTIK